MNEDIIEGLVSDWDEVSIKGQMGLWVLLAISDGSKYTAEILDYINSANGGRFDIKEQSLYRALRRFKGMKMVDIIEKDSPSSGSKRKYYSLTPIGKSVLGRFITIHILPLQQPAVVQSITNAAKGANYETH